MAFSATHLLNIGKAKPSKGNRRTTSEHPVDPDLRLNPWSAQFIKADVANQYLLGILNTL